MNERMEAALEASIEKWKRRAEMHQKGVWPNYPSGVDCPLCMESQKQAGEYASDICFVCPVFLKIGQKRCVGTPYREYMRAYDARSYRSKSQPSEQLANLAMDEVDFLESLKEP